MNPHRKRNIHRDKKSDATGLMRLTQRWKPQSGYLRFALGVSLLLHCIVLAIHFTFPSRVASNNENTLEVVFVNTQTDTPPPEQRLLSQYHSDGGGNLSDNDVNRAPLERPQALSTDAALSKAEQQQADLDAQKNKIMAQLQAMQDQVQAQAEQGKASSEQMALAQELAAMSERLQRNNHRPRTHFFAPSSSEYRFANYVLDWQMRIESIGNKHYPEEVRGKVYGSLRLTVYVSADGSVKKIEIDDPKASPILVKAAQDIVRLSSPFPPFPANIATDTDILAITRTWHFSNDQFQTDAGNPR